MAQKKIHDTPSTRVMAYRKRRMEGMKRVEIWLQDDELSHLDSVTEELGVSRARVVAQLLIERTKHATAIQTPTMSSQLSLNFNEPTKVTLTDQPETLPTPIKPEETPSVITPEKPITKPKESPATQISQAQPVSVTPTMPPTTSKLDTTTVKITPTEIKPIAPPIKPTASQQRPTPTPVTPSPLSHRTHEQRSRIVFLATLNTLKKGLNDPKD